MACNSGYAGKINEYFGCVNNGIAREARLAWLKRNSSAIYSVWIFSTWRILILRWFVMLSMRSAGYRWYAQSRDRPIWQDWCQSEEVNYQSTVLLHAINRSKHEMDGEKAIMVLSARGLVAPTYGQSNFDRASSGFMALAKHTGTLTDFIGDYWWMPRAKNLRTNIGTKEIRTIMNLGSEIKRIWYSELSFVEEAACLTGTAGGTSIVQPAAGLYDYDGINAYKSLEIYTTPLSKEKSYSCSLEWFWRGWRSAERTDKIDRIRMKLFMSAMLR